MKVSSLSAIIKGRVMQIAKTLRNWRAGYTGYVTRMGGALAALGMVALLAAAPSAQAQIKNGGFEEGTFNHWTLKDYNRPNLLANGSPTQFSQLNLVASALPDVAGSTVNTTQVYRSRILNASGIAPNTQNVVQYPFSGMASAKVGADDGVGNKAVMLSQTATMSLADVDPVDGKVHIRFAMAPVLYDAGHSAQEQPFFFVEVINVTKSNTQIFQTFNFAGQSGIPWTKSGNYRSTNWQGFDISPGNGQLDPGDQVLLRVVASNCQPGANNHTAEVYMDVFGSKMPGLNVVATGPSTTQPGQQITYNYTYTNDSGVYALNSWVRLAAPVTVDGKYLTFVPGSYPAGCTGIHAGISPRADYIDCPVGDLVAGAGGSFPVTFTVPADAATTGPNNVINNGDYDVRANTVSPFIGPLVKTTIVGNGVSLLDLGITISNGNVPSYLVNGPVTYTVTVTNNGPVDAVDAVIVQNTLTGVTAPGSATWTCSSGAGTAVCGGTGGVINGTGLLNTIGSLPVGQSLTYTITTLQAAVAGTPVVTTVSVAPPAGMSDSVAANNTAGLSTPVSAAQYALTVNTIGTGLGGVNAVPAASACAIGVVPAATCSTQQLGGSDDAYLTAVAGTKTVFKGWTGNCTTVTGNECHVNMANANKDVTAEFAAAWVVTPTVIGGTWTGDPLVEDGQTGTITVTPNVAGQVPVVSSDTCTVVQGGPDGSGAYTYTTAVMHADCAFTVTFPSPQLTVAKSASVTNGAVGTAFTYTVTVTNSGAVATMAATSMTDMVPVGLTLNSVAVVAPANGTTCAAVAGQLVSCTIPAGLAAADSRSFTITVTPTVAIVGTTVYNTASVSGGGDNACPVANPCRSNTVDTPVGATPQLSIAKTASVTTAVVGVAFNYTLTVTNSGSGATTAVATVTDTVPADLTIGTLPAGCALSAPGSQTVECTIAAGLSHMTGSNTRSFVIPVTPEAAVKDTTVSNTASVIGGGDPACAAIGDCESTTVNTPVTAPALSIAKSASVATAVVFVPFNYTLTVTNDGTAATSAVATVTDTVPADLTIGTLPADCALSAPGSQTVECTIAAGLSHMAGSNTRSFVIPVTPEAAVKDTTVSNTASVIGGGDPACAAIGDCESTTVNTPVTAPALSIAKSASVAAAVVSVPFNYTFTVTNGGTAATSVVATVTDVIPAGLAIGTLPAGCALSAPGSRTVECTIAAGLSNVAGSNTVSFVIPVTAESVVNGTTVANVVSIAGGGDPACATAGACISTTVNTPVLAPHLDIVKSGPVTATVGTPFDYTITVTNAGTANATQSVIVTDAVPAGLTINSVTPGCAISGQNVSCTVAGARLAIGSSVTITINVTPTATGSLSNTASATGGGDPACVTVCVSPPVVTGVGVTPIDAVDDVPPPVNGGDGNPNLVNVYDNDTLNGVPLDPALIDGTVVTPATPINGGSVPTLDPATGVVSVPPRIPAGDYTITYRICEKANPTNCDDATVTVTVTAPVIDAVDDMPPPVNGGDGNPNLVNVYDNDTLNGVPLDPARIDGTVVTPATPINGGSVPTLDPATGVVSVPPGIPAGDYTITYRICEKVNPTNCDDATVTVTVTAPVIDAVDDMPPPVNGGDGNPNLVNVYDNDTLNGVPLDPALIDGTVVTPATPINGGSVPTLDPATGVVSVPLGIPAGGYTITYRICEKLNPTNCDEATVTVTVEVTPIEAVEDTSEPLTGDSGSTTPSVLDNDRLGGKPIQPGQVTLMPGTPSHPGLTMNPDGTIRIGMLVPMGTYAYPYTICEVLNPSNCSTTTATVIVTGMVELRVVKTSAVREVRLGDLVRYTLTVENTGAANLSNGSVIDTPPAGFSYVEGSLTVADGDNVATVSGQQPLRFNGLDVPAGGKATLVYLMRVGAGVRAGTLVNQAQAYSPDGEPMSNVATAEVMLVADPLIDDSLVFGTVFNDRDGDGWQDSAAMSGVKVQGGFAADAYVANSTTVDRGAGMRPEADASSPLLHGIAVGTIAGRQSEADLPENRQVVIRQTLRELSFTDDFVLTNDQGVTLRMDRNGSTTVEKSGDAVKGLNAAAPTVERRIAQGAEGYVVDYVVRNAGIDERGVPGVRIASVEGLLIETDQFGRYHLAGVNGGAWERGRNFILKVDPSTLPAGTEFSTDNPLLRRVTPGVPARFDWGVKLPEQVIEGGSRQEELEMGEVFFAPGNAEVQARYQPVVEAIAGKLREHPKAEVVIQATANNEALAFERIAAIKAALLAQLDEATARTLVVTARTVEQPSSLVAGVNGEGVLLGTVLFDTDKAAIRPEFEALLDKVAAALEQRGGGSVSIVGHTDVRASHAYNTALGMRRAKAVFDALASRLSPAVRGKLRVETDNVPAASAGKRN